MKNSISIGELLNESSGDFGQILRRVKELRKLTKQLQHMVDAPLNQHIFVANIRENKLIVGTDSAVWHTRVKYLAPMILEQMRAMNGLSELRSIEFRVQPLGTEQITDWKPATEVNNDGF